MELWDLHPLRRIDDSGFIKELYGTQNAHPRANDPDYQREQAKKKEDAIASIRTSR
jgi:hypothetical protein